MSAQFVSDIIYFVIKVEKEGAKFYQKLAGEVRDPAVRNVFLGLARDEVQHQKDFEALARGLERSLFSLDSEESLVEVMSAAAGELTHSISGAELVDMEGATLKEALDIGIHTEKETIRVYSQLLKIKYSELTKVLPGIIGEERKHLLVLEDMKTRLLG